MAIQKRQYEFSDSREFIVDLHHRAQYFETVEADEFPPIEHAVCMYEVDGYQLYFGREPWDGLEICVKQFLKLRNLCTVFHLRGSKEYHLQCKLLHDKTWWVAIRWSG